MNSNPIKTEKIMQSSNIRCIYCLKPVELELKSESDIINQFHESCHQEVQNYKHPKQMQDLFLWFKKHGTHITDADDYTIDTVNATYEDFVSTDEIKIGKTDSIPDSIGLLTNIKKLTAVDCGLKLIPDSIGNMKSLLILDLKGNELEELPETLGNLHNLIFLYLGDNNLDSLPDSCRQLSKLERIDLHQNRFAIFPETLNRDIRQINLSKNHLETIPEFINEFHKLEQLQLRENNLNELSFPETLYGLSNLDTLYLSYNSLTSVPSVLNHLKNLRTLSLVENKLVSLPELFVDTLYYLYLENNQLTTIPKPILLNIEKVHMSNNPLSLETKLDLIEVDLMRLREHVQDLSERPRKLYREYFNEYVFEHLTCYRCNNPVEKVNDVGEVRKIIDDQMIKKINWIVWGFFRCKQDHYTLVDLLKVYETMISLRKRNKLFSDIKIAYNDSSKKVDEVQVKNN